MPAKLIKHTVTAEYAPLSASELFVPRAEVSTATTNSGNSTFRYLEEEVSGSGSSSGATGNDTEWEAGEYHTFIDIDLSRLQVKGTAGDVVTVNASGARV